MPTHSGAGTAAQRRGLFASIAAWVALWLKACLDAWEEALQGLLRESLSITQRAINGASAWTLSVFNRDYKAQLRGRWAVLEQQYSWWGQTDVGDKRSTLNAVLARKFDGDASSPAAAGTATAPSATAAAPAGVAGSQEGLRHRRPASNSQERAYHAASPPAKPSAAGLSEIEPLPAEGPEQVPQGQKASHGQRPQQQHAAGAGAAAESGAQQWWDTPANWLSEIADEATEAAAAAQEAATAAVQQAASTMTHAVEEAAATAASWARSMRAVFVEPPAGWGVHEAIKQTGLLEDVSLYGQLLISRIFDKLRWLLGKLTFSPVAQTPTAAAAAAAARQRASALHSPSSSSSTAASTPPAAGHRPGFFDRLRSPRHPATVAAAGAGAEAGGLAAAGRRGLAGGLSSVGAGGRLKLRSVTSVDLPNTHRLSLEAEEDSDIDQQADAADESGLSDSSSGAYDDAQDDASSEASCSNTSSWTQQHQHGPMAAASALAAAGTASSAAMPTSAAADYSDLPGPSLTVRVPQSALHGGSSIGRDRQGKVSFAAGQQRQALKHGAAADGIGAEPTPFATAVVQKQHQAHLAQPGPAAATSSSKEASPAGKTRGARGSSSRGGSSKHRQRVPEGLGAVLPGRGKRGLLRSHSGPAVSALKEVSSAGQVIRMAGYPLEVHEVVTHDGYLLRMERIPQPASRDAVFMMHGVLDTSLTWVAGGITGSQAFAAWDRGFDVWLGTSRCNPPHEAADPARRGSRYWVYSNNEVGVYDMGAQIDHIHAVKMRELTALGRTPSNSRRASTTDTTTGAAGRSGRRPSGRRSSGSTASSRQPIPEHADVLEGIVDADALVGIQHVRMGDAAAAIGTGGVGKPAQALQESAPSGCAGAGVQLPSEPHKASSAPPVVTDNSSAGLKQHAYEMSRAQSAAEVDLQAAAEAAEAFNRQRAARIAAGVSPTGAGYWAEQQDGQEGGDQPQPQTAGQGVLAPLTPTANAAASAAARAASALGSAVATAAAAAGGMIGLSPATPVSPTSNTVDPHAADASGQGQGSIPAGLNILPGSRNGSTTVSARGATSGLLERLLGGTVPASDAALVRGSSSMGLQTQGSGMRQSASAPDVSALAGLEGVTDTSSSSSLAAGSAQNAVGAGEGKAGCSRRGSGSSAAGSSGAEGSTGRTRRARRGSCPYFSLEGSPVARRVVQHEFDADSGADMQQQQQQQHPEQQQQEQQSVGVSPFSQQQPPDLQQPQLAEGAGGQAPQQLQQRQQEQPFPASMQPQQQQSRVQGQHGHHGHHHHQQRPASQGVSSPTAASRPANGGTGHVTAARSSSWGLEPRPYNLRVVCHSLGGLLMLIYCTQRARAGRPHHISRLIMLSPAGFHPIIPGMFKPLVYIWRPLMLWTQLVWRQQGFPVQLPTFVARMLAFKLSIDTSKLPAVGDLLRSMARLLLGGDRSAWDRALLMPHYTAKGMPLLSSRQVLHFIQLYLTGRCQLFDYGSEAANVAAYQQRTPPVVSDAFHMLRDVPVHLVAGEHDGVIPASNIRCHYAAMRAANMDVSYREFDYGHMDFTFSAKEELGWYVMSLLMRT